MAKPTLTVVEETPASAEADMVKDLTWTKALDAPLLLLAPLLVAWLFAKHHKRVRAAFAAQAAKVQDTPAPTLATNDTTADVIVLEELREPSVKRSRHG